MQDILNDDVAMMINNEVRVYLLRTVDKNFDTSH